MSKYARKRTRKGVESHSTPEQRCKQTPPSKGLKTLLSAKDILRVRHIELGSLADLSWELGGVNRGTLSGVEHGREPSAKLLAKLNSVYGCHLHKNTVKITVEVCPRCGGVPTPRHRCPGAATKYAPHPVMRIAKIRRILQNPYLKDS